MTRDDSDDDQELRLQDEPAAESDAAKTSAAYYTQQAAAREPVPTARPAPSVPRSLFVSGVYTFPWYLSTLVTWTYLAVGLTVTALLLALCYHMMNILFSLGRILALPIGMVTVAAISYASAVYLTVVEQTSEGYDVVEDWPGEGWREWFWTIPSTFGMMGVAAFTGWLVSRLLSISPLFPMLIAMWLLGPILQLGSMDAGSILMPFSRRVFDTFRTHWWAWGKFYMVTLALGVAFGGLAWITFVDPPYVTLLILAPIAATLVLVYARLLGRLAWCFGPERRQATE